jgi:hypothetical protein
MDVAGSVAASAAIAVAMPKPLSSSPRPAFVPKLALAQVTQDDDSDDEEDDPLDSLPTEEAEEYEEPRSFTPELSLEQILEDQTELPLSHPVLPQQANAVLRKRCVHAISGLSSECNPD